MTGPRRGTARAVRGVNRSVAFWTQTAIDVPDGATATWGSLFRPVVTRSAVAPNRSPPVSV
jgi:hypothetical protein